ncbi:MAG TPA: VIT and VWA domain-containing protein [Candidatus Sulfopaludibacter sp.]|jgi:Ca-activated chloride channel family protein|nr:VIT and VWA domain-containing protein [Candidatus Sulfopaludibacter sp.]
MKPLSCSLLLAFCLLPRASGDAGVLVPVGRDKPDPKIFSLDEMTIDIHIENGDARIAIRQIFGSHTSAVEEGTYSFALPSSATVSDFAVWDGLTRIPGVILERRRAEELYESIKQQTIDPGLLEQGEHDAASARRNSAFTVHIVPIPAYGTKRVEMEYHERIPVEALRSALAIPLRPDVYQAVTAGVLRINFDLESRLSLRDFQAASLRVTERTANHVWGSFEARDFALTQDFTATWELDPAAAGRLEILTHRNPAESPTGFFQALQLLPDVKADEAPRTVVALFDTSLSMQWEKLERSYRALDQLLHGLRPRDRFNLLLFNSQVTSLESAPVAATPAEVEKALAFVKGSSLRGGTDLGGALEQALRQDAQYLVVISDCGATEGAIRNSKLAAQYSEAWKALPVERRPRTYIFGVGDDANLPLMGLLAANDGVFEWVRSTEPIDFKLGVFLAKLGKRPVNGLTLTVSPRAGFDLIYPLEDRFFPGSVAGWVGQYGKPGQAATFADGGAGVQVRLPAQDLANSQLPRTWARARVDALLAKIEREGEDRASIDEIIRLSRKYKFVTPYTSFLAAPRALLRPRVIRPGDPVIRVKTDPTIESVVAIFPFGLTKPLRYLKEEETWQTRFLAPADMADGAYPVRLVLRDREGRVFRESKTFVIASQTPVLRVRLPRLRFRPGEIVNVRVSASASARTIVARLYGAAPVDLHWSQQAGASTGDLTVPQLPPGKYALTVTAEDIAHNIGSQEVTVEILP